MIFSRSEHLRQMARERFMHHFRRGTLGRLWSSMVGTPSGLIDIGLFHGLVSLNVQSDAGIQVVPIAEIVGSEGRSTEFDAAWRPLTDSNKERWVNMAAAYCDGTGFPAVDLIRIGRYYFVRDGHHRISVARAYGQVDIEANVIDWQIPFSSHTTERIRNPHSGWQTNQKEYNMLYDIEEIRQMDRDRRQHLRRSYEHGLADAAWLRSALGRLVTGLGQGFVRWGQELQRRGQMEPVFRRNTPGSRSGAGL
jgi:hypothetical protein